MSLRGGVLASPASCDYAEAYRAHYSDRDLVTALELYQELVAAYPDAREAGYSRTQIVNIVGAVVPQADLLDAQLALALEHLGDTPDLGNDPRTVESGPRG